MTLLTLLFVAFSIFVNFYHKFPSLVKSFTAFVNKNILRRTDGDSSGETGVNKLLIRFLDTLGTICALTGLILGISSLFIDQYDFTFEPQGVLNDVGYKEYIYLNTFQKIEACRYYSCKLFFRLSRWLQIFKRNGKKLPKNFKT